MRSGKTVIPRKLHRRTSGIRRCLDVAFFLTAILLCVIGAAAQETDMDDAAPPPLRVVTRGERGQLESQPDVKRRTDLALRLMDARIKKAEDLKLKEEYDQMFLELGGFHGLMDNMLDFLQRENAQRGRVLAHFKRYEMGLRTFSPRIELIRRDLPGRYDVYVKALAKYLRDARSRAIEPFFGDTVVPNRRT